jgi:basic membrane protein A
MGKKSIVIVLLALSMLLGSVLAAGAQDPIKVVYLVNGNLGDKGFYDSAASGLYRMRDELGADIKIIEMGRDETSYEGNYLDVSEQDWDMIISGTWSVKELAQNIAAEFPEKDYLFFDGEVDFSVVKDGNMMGVTYLSNEGAFMAGALAALMLDSGDVKIDPTKRILGFVGSMDTPNINDFLVGYIEGIQYIDPEIKLMTSYVGSFEDVPKALEMTKHALQSGCADRLRSGFTEYSRRRDCLIRCGQIFCGLRSGIWTQLQDTDPNLARNILSSSLKNVGDSLFTAVSGYIDGSMVTSENYVLGLSSGAVGLAYNKNYETLVPEAIRTQFEEIKAKIISGEIKVGTAFGVQRKISLRCGME